MGDRARVVGAVLRTKILKTAFISLIRLVKACLVLVVVTGIALFAIGAYAGDIKAAFLGPVVAVVFFVLALVMWPTLDDEIRRERRRMPGEIEY